MLDGGLSLEPMREGAKRWKLCALPIVHGFCPWQEVEGTSSMELCVFGFVEVSLAELYVSLSVANTTRRDSETIGR